MGANNEAEVIGVLGRTGTGKSTTLKKRIKSEKGTVLIWDFKREYDREGVEQIDNIFEFIRSIRSERVKRLAFCPSMKETNRKAQFDIFCRFALELGNCLVVVEEMRFVTKAQWSPEAWALLTMTGRHDGVRVIGTSQRPASVDKDFFGNCTTIRCFSMTYPEDIAVVSKAMNIDSSRISELEPFQFIEWKNGKARKGRLAKPK